jgi:competence protein ComEC
MTRHDLGSVCALAGLVGGVFVGERAGGAGAMSVLVLGLGLLAVAVVLDGAVRVFVAAIALALCGAATMQRALDGLQHSPVSAATTTEQVAVLRGALVSDPDGQRFTIDALVRLDGAHRIVLVRTSGADAGRLRIMEAGDRIVVRGRLAPVPAVGYDARFRWDHAVAMLEDVEVEGFAPASNPLFIVANRARDVVLRGTAPLDPNARALLAGFLLGDTRAIPDDIADAYRDSGLSHLLAVSGANVAFVLLLCTPLLRRCSLVPRTALALGVVLCFAAATRFEPSVLRASALAAVTILSTFVGRPVARVRALVLAIVVLLLADPFLVHSIGFRLSCAASAGIALAAPACAARIPGPRLVREQLAVSVAAQLGVTPVLLLTFGTVPLLGPVANLVAAPAAEAVGVFGLGASIAGGFVPALGAVLAPFTAALLAWVTTVAEITARIGIDIDTRGVGVLGAVIVVAMVARRARRPVPDAAPR